LTGTGRLGAPEATRAEDVVMDDVTKTDKMLSRKDGRVGYVIFNNPERHNAVSLDMW